MDMTSNIIINASLLPDLERDEELARAEIAILVAIFLITVSGNSAVLMALYARKYCDGNKKLSRMYYFILHLCVADLLTGLLNVFPQLCWEVTYRFRGGNALCKMVKYGQTLGPYLSSYILVATALDRYKAVCQPLRHSSWASTLTVWAAWVLSLLCCMPQAYLFSYQEIAPGVFDCWATFPSVSVEKLYVIWYSVSVFLVPLAVLLYTYTIICWTLWSYSSPLDTCSPKLISRAKLNTVRQTVAVIFLYIICSSPFICVQLWACFNPDHPFKDGSLYQNIMPLRAFIIVGAGAVFTIVTLLSSLNSCANPWIYLNFNRELGRSLLRALGCGQPTSPRHRFYTTSSSRRPTTEVTSCVAVEPANRCQSVDGQLVTSV